MSKKGSKKTNSQTLKGQRKKQIKKLVNEKHSLSKNKKLIEFISLYIDSEASARKLVDYYKSDIDEKSKPSDPLVYPDVGDAAKHFGLKIDSQIIAKVFKSSKGIRGSKTPRQLRNPIIHSKSAPDIKEVEERFEELSTLMKMWLEKVQSLINS